MVITHHSQTSEMKKAYIYSLNLLDALPSLWCILEKKLIIQFNNYDSTILLHYISGFPLFSSTKLNAHG